MNVQKKSVRFLNWVKSKITDHAIILGYHRISKSENDPYHLNVSPENFSQHLEVIRKYAEPVSLQSLAKKLDERRLSGKYIAVTFDDGYSDNFYRAKPLLEKYDIPATIFIPTGKLNSEYWWDELERLILSTAIAPEELNLQYSNGIFFWKYTEKDKRTPYWSLFMSLYNHMHNLQETEIYEILGQLKNLIDSRLIRDYKYRTMTTDEILLLTSGSLISAGSHTVTHRNLKLTDLNNQTLEIQKSKEDLENILGKPVLGFSYPHGSNNSELRSLVKSSGYSYACISYPNYTFQKSDRYSLPRFWTRDCDGDKFEKWLKGFRN